MKIVFIGVGTCGDVHPLIALAVGLSKKGHDIRFVSNTRFEQLIRSHNLDFVPVDMDFNSFMESDEAKSYFNARNQPLKAITGIIPLVKSFKPHARQMLEQCVDACEDAEALVSITIVPGFHIAEKKGIPFFNYLPFPMHPTRDFSHPLIASDKNLGGTFNKLSGYFFNHIFWLCLKRFVNDWRKTLILPQIRFPIQYMDKLQTPFLYSFSPTIIPKPKEWEDWQHIIGYMFLEPATSWEPPRYLTEFLDNGPPPLFVGFGSSRLDDKDKMIDIIIPALEKTKQRVIISMGTNVCSDIILPDTMLPIDFVPFHWLFPKTCGIICHGGAGTSSWALKAGKPCLSLPVHSDQLFWASRLSVLGVCPKHIHYNNLTPDNFQQALDELLHDTSMHARCSAFSAIIEKEDGVANAIAIIERYIGNYQKPFAQHDVCAQ